MANELTGIRNLLAIWQDLQALESALTLVVNAEPTMKGHLAEIARLQAVQAEIQAQTERDKVTAEQAKREAGEATENLIREIAACKTKLGLQVSHLEAQAREKATEIEMDLLALGQEAKQERRRLSDELVGLQGEVIALAAEKAELTEAIGKIAARLRG